MINQPSCLTCRYCQPIYLKPFAALDEELRYDMEHNGVAYGNCRRFPPIPIRYDDNELIAQWPEMEIHEWCGEFKPREDP